MILLKTLNIFQFDNHRLFLFWTFLHKSISDVTDRTANVVFDSF